MPALCERDSVGERVVAVARQSRIHAVDPERRAVVVVAAERPRLARVLRRHVEPALVAVHRVAVHVRRIVASVPRELLEVVRDAAEVPREVVALERARRDVRRRALVVAPAHGVGVRRVAHVRRRAHLQVLHVEARVGGHRGILVADRVVGMVGGRAESAGVVGNHMAEGVPPSRRDFLRARDGVTVRSRDHHLLAVNPQRNAVVAPALERPCAGLGLLDVELPYGIRFGVVHVAERSRGLRVVREEQRLVMRDRAARRAAGLLVEAADNAVLVAQVAVAEVARREHRAAVRRDVDGNACAFADVESAEERRSALKAGCEAVADSPLAADRALHLLVADERPRAIERHVAVARQRGVPRRRRAVRLGERPPVRVAILEAGGDEVRDRPVGRGVELAALEHNLPFVRVVLVPRQESREHLLPAQVVVDDGNPFEIPADRFQRIVGQGMALHDPREILLPVGMVKEGTEEKERSGTRAHEDRRSRRCFAVCRKQRNESTGSDGDSDRKYAGLVF